MLDLLEQRLAAAPARALASGSARTRSAEARLGHALAIGRARMAARLDGAAARLLALDPDRVLARGYALLTDGSGAPITSVTRLAVGDAVTARLADGCAALVATSIEPASERR